METLFVKATTTDKVFGYSRFTRFNHIKKGTFPPAVEDGAARLYPMYEVQAIQVAKRRGEPVDVQKALVIILVALRQRPGALSDYDVSPERLLAEAREWVANEEKGAGHD